MPFLSAVDIANRACQHLGAMRISSLSDNSRQANEINFCYDKLRRAELRRSTWRFATRRAFIRLLTATSLRFIPAAYASGTTYTAGQIIQDSSGVYWISPYSSNTGNTPGDPVTGQPLWWQQYFGSIYADVWSSTATYGAGELVYKTGPTFYICTANASLNDDPASGAPWVAMPGTPTSLATVFLQPAGPGMTVENPGGRPSTIARNQFALPYGFMRPLPPDPKVASVSHLQTSAAMKYLDYQFEGDNIISASDGPLLLRYVADVSDVTIMDDLYCEGLGARIAYETCEIITQSGSKLNAIAASYQKFMNDARQINYLETGNTEDQEPDYPLRPGEPPPAPAQQQGQQEQGG